MKANQIRRRFLDHFRRWDHLVVDSYPLIPIDDPTTLFVSAGMQPLQPYYQGVRQPPAPRLASCQRCVRTWDLDEVGKTDRHATFFEMLGNFAPTGDYFKETAIRLAWKLLTEDSGFGLPKARLRVTTHPEDEAAREAWRQETDVNPDWIYKSEDNWWGLASGLGPCGPDSEIWWDRGLEHGCGNEDCYPDHCDRFFEVWNLVFPEFDGQPDGGRRPLERPAIDTGMGIERIAAVMQGVAAIAETDLFLPLIEFAHSSAEREDQFSARVIADHLRSMTFIIADGVRPANEGRGYVLRRLIRRAALHARRLGLRAPLDGGVPVVADIMSEPYPYLAGRLPDIRAAVRAECEAFERTLERGLEMFERVASNHREVIPGQEAFQLHDTFGLTLELTEELAAERGLQVDRQGFQVAMAEQRERSRRVVAHNWDHLAALPRSEFVGYSKLDVQAEVVKIRRPGEEVAEAGEGDVVEIYLDRTPFYAESGGQIGDTGRLLGPDGEVLVEDVKRPFEGTIAHLGRVVVGRIRAGERVQARVDEARRHQIMRHHTATHLLNRALEEILGKSNLQRGSWVGPDHTTFDFPLDRPLTDQELDRLSARLSQQIRSALPLDAREMPHEEAIATGATHLFDERYGDVVRVVAFGDWSREFCGGTHCATTAEVGTAVVLSEASVGQGLRRIDLTVGEAAESLVRQRLGEINRLGRMLGVGADQVPARVEALRHEAREARREADRLRDELRQAHVSRSGANGAKPRAARVPLILEQVPAVGMDDLRAWADRFLEALGGVGIVGVANDQNFVIKVSRELAKEFDATRLVPLAGQGGGRPELAQGRLTKDADQAFTSIEEALR